MPECLLRRINILDLQSLGNLLVELERNISVGGLESIKQGRRDSQSMAAGQLLDFTSVSEGSSHDDGVDIVRVVVVEDFSHKHHSGVLSWVIVRFPELFLAPVQQSADERRDEKQIAVRTGDSLDHMEDQSHVDFNPTISEHLSRFDTLPSCGDLDQNSVGVDSCMLVEGHDPVGSFKSLDLVERKAGIDFSRHVSFDSFQKLAAERNADVIKDQIDQLSSLALIEFDPFSRLVVSRLSTIGAEVLQAEVDRVFEDTLELRPLSHLQDEGRVGGGIFRVILLDEVEVPSVSNDEAVLFEVDKLVLRLVLSLHLISDTNINVDIEADQYPSKLYEGMISVHGWFQYMR